MQAMNEPVVEEFTGSGFDMCVYQAPVGRDDSITPTLSLAIRLAIYRSGTFARVTYLPGTNGRMLIEDDGTRHSKLKEQLERAGLTHLPFDEQFSFVRERFAELKQRAVNAEGDDDNNSAAVATGKGDEASDTE